MSTILEVQHVSKYFAGVHALEDVSFQVQEGSIHAVIGPNGSGKTTLFNIVTGVYKPTSGSAVMRGTMISNQPPYQVARLGVGRTFQHPRPFRSMSVLDHLRAAATATGFAWRFPPGLDAEAEETLEFVGLGGKGSAHAASLPQGSLRQLEIARALMGKPKLLLLDEPHAGLNQTETENLMNVIGRLPGKGITVMLVEHEMRVVMTLAHQITVLNFGRLLAEGTPRAIQTNPEVVTAYLGTGRRRHHA